MMRLADEIVHGFAEPVISPRPASRLVHPLLHDTPLALLGEKETVMIKLIPVLHRRRINLRAHLRRENQAIAVADRPALGEIRDLARRLAAGGAFPARDVNSQIRAEMLVRLLHRPASDGRYTRRMPIKPK